MTSKNITELLGTYDGQLPVTIRQNTPYNTYLTEPSKVGVSVAPAGSQYASFVDLACDASLPFFKIYGAVKGTTLVNGWILKAEIQLLFKGVIRERYPFETCDQTAVISEAIRSCFVTGTGSPSSDMIILNHDLITNANSGLVPKRICSIADKVRIAVTQAKLCDGGVFFVQVEQSNHNF